VFFSGSCTWASEYHHLICTGTRLQWPRYQNRLKTIGIGGSRPVWSRRFFPSFVRPLRRQGNPPGISRETKRCAGCTSNYVLSSMDSSAVNRRPVRSTRFRANYHAGAVTGSKAMKWLAAWVTFSCVAVPVWACACARLKATGSADTAADAGGLKFRASAQSMQSDLPNRARTARWITSAM